MSTGLPTLDADLGSGVRAFFTTRAGGVSAGEHASLNVGLNVDDEPRRVLANLDLVRREAGSPLALASQVHGAEVHVVTRRPRPGRTVARADALATTMRRVALGVVVADCVPVLLADPGRGVVATIHAGRGGLVTGVVAATLEAVRALGARDLRAVVGPAVCGQCYEVPAAMRDEVERIVPGTASSTSWGTPSLDLPAGVVGQLTAGEVAAVTRVPACTFTDERFFSHRRWTTDGSRRGRFLGVVQLD